MGLMDRIKEEAASTMAASFSGMESNEPQAVQEQPAPRPSAARIPEYVVLQVVLKEKMIGTGSGNLSELENVINAQARKGYRLHTISTASGGSSGLIGGDRIQATLVFEKL